MATPVALVARPLALVALAFALGLPLGAAAERIAGSGVTTTEMRSVRSFHRLAVEITAEVEVRQGAEGALTVTGDDNVVPRVETVVENGTLHLRWKDRRTDASYGELRIVVPVRDLDDVALAGAGSVRAAALRADRFRVTLGGSGNVTIDALAAQDVALTLAGSGDARIGGQATTLDATLAGSGDLAADALATRRARVALHGSGHAQVRASEALDVAVNGSGDVVYHGTPTVRQAVHGSGSVTAAAR
ncbi:MAG: head GIN domain-containing protein [Burkholderiales bacterium]